jgi:hypothetical protein
MPLAPPSPPFERLRPTRTLHVRPDGDDAADGGARRPMRTIQAALDSAGPGAAVLVHAGEYGEAVRFPSRGGGRPDAPIWLRSADGPGRAVIRPPKDQSGIKGLGVRNVVVDGFAVVGGVNGVQFSQSGNDFRALCENIVIRENVVRGAREDGIKVSQATGVWVLGNTVSDCGDQCVDYVNVWTGVLSGNRLSGARKAAAFFVKGGSQRIWIVSNSVTGLRGRGVAGIAVGGHTGEGFARLGSPEAEVQEAVVRGNRVTDVQGYALATLGAQDVRIEGNILESLPGPRGAVAASVIAFSRGSPKRTRHLSRNVVVSDNWVSGGKAQWLHDKQFQDPDRDRLVVTGNRSFPAGQAPVR